MKKYLQLIRAKHWLKNVLIFLPLIFSGNIFNLSYFSKTLVGFILFSLVASIIYIMNDIRDLDSDRKHEIKKHRPLASGAISIKKAIFTIFILSIFSIALTCYLFAYRFNIAVIALPIIYLILNIAYSFGLKKKPVFDVVILVSGFLIRVLFGASIIMVEISNWLYLTIVFASFYLGFGKRRNEMIKQGHSTRSVLKYYTKEFLDKNMYVCLTLAIVFYSLWCVDPITISKIGSNLLVWSVPFVVILFLLYSLNVEGDSHGDPIDVILSDKVLLVSSIIYSLFMFWILYGSRL